MIRFARPWLLLLSLVVFSLSAYCPHAFAAQDAVVTVDQAPIREQPTMDAKIIETKTAGSTLRISSSSKDGWYKVRTANGQFGWMWQADLALKALSEHVSAASLELRDRTHERRELPDFDHPFYVKFAGLYTVFTSVSVSENLGLESTKAYGATGFILEAGFGLSERLLLALRYMTYSGSTDFTIQNTAYGLTLSSAPLLLGLNYDFFKTDTVTAAMGVYGGWSFGNTLTLVAPTFGVPNTTEVSSSGPAAYVNFDVKYWLFKQLAFVGELGIYYTHSPSKQISTTFNGDSVFRDPQTNSPTAFSTSMFGPVFALGVQLNF
jgi:hypothetical protein